MSDWYVSSTAFAAIAAFTPGGVYTVGMIVKPTAPALKANWVFRCTIAGTASTEPAWPTANNATVASGGATFANVTGQSTYFWAAAAGDIPTLLGAVGTFRFAAGDRMFVSSDHAETQNSVTVYGSSNGSSTFGVGQVLSVNRAGSTPPVAADLTAGASITVSAGKIQLDSRFPVYHYGMNYIYTGATGNAVELNNTNGKTTWLDACQIYLNSAAANLRIQSTTQVTLVLNNSTLRFGATSHGVTAAISAPLEVIWLNTASAVAGAIFPTILFVPGSSTMLVTARGVDLSSIAGTIYGGSNTLSSKFLLDSCRIASGVTRYGGGSAVNTSDLVELVNCYDGTNFISESYQVSGAVTTEPTITLSGGATDNVGTFSHKMASNTNIDKYTNTLNSFWMDVNYATTGSSKTATVEIISSAVLNNDDISLELEYLGTAGSSLASFANSLPNILATASAVTTSTATWNSSPATPQKQKLQVTFTPRTVGRVRGRVRLGKPSVTVYVDPQVTIT